MRRRLKTWNITGEVVPPGTLEPNPHNPNGKLTPEERRAIYCEVDKYMIFLKFSYEN